MIDILLLVIVDVILKIAQIINKLQLVQVVKKLFKQNLWVMGLLQ